MAEKATYIIEFVAALPDIKSAISLPGAAGEPARLQLEIPAQDVDKLVKLWEVGAGRSLNVIIAVGGVTVLPATGIPVTGNSATDDMDGIINAGDEDLDAIMGA